MAAVGLDESGFCCTRRGSLVDYYLCRLPLKWQLDCLECYVDSFKETRTIYEDVGG